MLKEQLISFLESDITCIDDFIWQILTKYDENDISDVAMYLVRAFKNRVWTIADVIEPTEEDA